jgi:hypothetical protein
MTKTNRLKIIDQILRNNKYDSLPDRQPLKPQASIANPVPTTKFVRFTYFGKQTRYITKLFRHTSVKVAYTTHTTLQILLFTPTPPTQDKYSRSVVYKLTCPDCEKVYIGQIDAIFHSLPRTSPGLHTRP